MQYDINPKIIPWGKYYFLTSGTKYHILNLEAVQLVYSHAEPVIKLHDP